MKRLIISIFLFAITVATCIAETIFLNNTADFINQEINNVIKETSDENLEYAIQLTENICINWQKREPLISTFINHDQLEEIGQTIISMKTNLCNGQFEDFFVESEIAKLKLNYLRDAETPSIKNIL